MTTPLNFRIRRFLCAHRGETGSASIEATLVLPAVFLLSMLLLFGAVYYFQSTWINGAASITANRIAHSWDNSNKHPVTGMYSPLQADPLYWRLLYGGTATVRFPGGIEEGNPHSVAKLKSGIDELSPAMSGGAILKNRGWGRTVIVEAFHPFQAPSFFGVQWGEKVAGRSSESIIEPAEFIRNIDLARAYLSMAKQFWDPESLMETLSPWLNSGAYASGDGKSLQFPVHAEAVRYLRSLVRGVESRFDTEHTGRWRLIDALDGQDIAHQAYLGVKRLNSDMRNQLMKDVEVMRMGKVKGVVWHFFRRTGDAEYGPDPTLRKELEKHGIAIVIHA